MRVPMLETQRLMIREFNMDDLDAIHQILDIELSDRPTGADDRLSHESRKVWLQWSILNYQELARLYQPPYGDRAVVLKATGELIGACGYVSYMSPFDQIPAMSHDRPATGLSTTEFGLYYALSPRHHRQGYATEAARALIDYAFDTLRLKHFVATTAYDNTGSIGVMRKLGMRIERNPYPDPPWLQVVGILEHDRLQ